MTETELKPCPFCGGEAEIIDDAIGTISRCRRCGAEIEVNNVRTRRCDLKKQENGSYHH